MGNVCQTTNFTVISTTMLLVSVGFPVCIIAFIVDNFFTAWFNCILFRVPKMYSFIIWLEKSPWKNTENSLSQSDKPVL